MEAPFQNGLHIMPGDCMETPVVAHSPPSPSKYSMKTGCLWEKNLNSAEPFRMQQNALQQSRAISFLFLCLVDHIGDCRQPPIKSFVPIHKVVNCLSQNNILTPHRFAVTFTVRF